MKDLRRFFKLYFRYIGCHCSINFKKVSAFKMALQGVKDLKR